jgi:hypothetical protein
MVFSICKIGTRNMVKNMATEEIRSRIHSIIDAMPLEKLDAVVAFLEDLQRSSEEETALLLVMGNMLINSFMTDLKISVCG